MEEIWTGPELHEETPRYAQLRERIWALIRERHLVAGDRLPTEVELAAQFGVSRVTVGRALQLLVDEGWLVRRRRAGTFVAAPADKDRVNPILVVEHPGRKDNDYFRDIYWAMHERLVGRGVMLRTVSVPGVDSFTELIGLDGDPLIVISPPRSALNDLLEVARSGKRVVVVGASWQGFGIVSLDSDNLMGAGLAVRHLGDLGHREIAFLGAFPEHSNTIDRERGFRTAMQARGLPVRPERVLMARSDHDPETQRALADLLAAPDRPTAIFAGGPDLALDAISAAAAADLRVPEDLSIVAYDDPPFMSRSSPAITTIRQPIQEMASAGAEVVFEIPSARHEVSPLVFDPEIVVRGTTAVPALPAGRTTNAP